MVGCSRGTLRHSQTTRLARTTSSLKRSLLLDLIFKLWVEKEEEEETREETSYMALELVVVLGSRE